MSIKTIVITTPVYNDWLSFSSLLREIDVLMDNKRVAIQVMAIDDGSTQSCATIQDQLTGLKHIHQVNVLHLARNLGHQKAIAIGLAYINANIQCDMVIVMDSDGEDQPADISRLIEANENNAGQIIFARRARRSEGFAFQIFYFIYRIFFRLLTGSEIAFGNFSLIPISLLQRVVYLPEIWNHFAAGIMRANQPWKSIPTQRGKRYTGKSNMNFVALVVHGLSAISVYIEILTVRLMLVAVLVIALSVISFLVLLYIKYLTPLAIPGWATNVAIGIVVIMFQAILLLALLSFLVLNYRSSKLFIPAKDFQDYFMNIERLR
jgi:polyisoprenyl-phosphate glycosyltransferase